MNSIELKIKPEVLLVQRLHLAKNNLNISCMLTSLDQQ